MLQGQGTEGVLARASGLPPDALRRRVGQRRQMRGMQAAICSLITLVRLAYCHAGSVPMIIPGVVRAVGT